MSAGRQERPPQAEMVGQVASALVEPSTHLIEAPTGTGKTMAYLVPAIEYARASGQTVIVAAHSRVLQSQIQSSLLDLRRTLDPLPQLFSRVVRITWI